MRLRPNRGEGERSKRKKNKAPQLVLTVLLFSTPVCMAQAATSSFERVAESPQIQSQQRTGLALLGRSSQVQSFQTKPSLLSPNVIAETDISALETILSSYRTKLASLTSKSPLDPANKETLTQAIEVLEGQIRVLEGQVSETRRLFIASQDAQKLLSEALSRYDQAVLARVSAQEVLRLRQDAYSLSQSNLADRQALADLARQDYDSAVISYNLSLANYDKVYSRYLTAEAARDSAQLALQDATNALLQAQQDYDTLLIPDAAWTPLTHEVAYVRQVPVITVVPREVVTVSGGLKAEVFNRQGYNNAPPLPTENELPIFTTTVSEISFQWGSGQVLGSGLSEDVIVRFTGNIVVPTSGYYQFYAPADDGVILKINGQQIISDWRDKGGGGSISQQIYLEAGANNTLQLHYYENGGGANVWLYYYTPNTGYQIVPASWLGQTTTTSIVYDYVTTYVDETYYVTEEIPNQVRPLINDPARLVTLQNAQATRNQCAGEYTSAQDYFTVSQTEQQEAAQDSTSKYDETIRQAGVLNLASVSLDSAKAQLLSAQGDVDQATLDLAATAQTEQQETGAKTSAETSSTAAGAALSSAYSAIDFTKLDPLLTEAETIINTPPEPEPEPEPEPTGSPDIPKDLSAENLMDVELDKVDPTELTVEQAEQLVEAALETFETAEEGSAEYEQALDALYLAAQQDDIVVDESIANIPGVGQAAEAVVAVLNIVGNVGADISPKARKKAQTLVVTTLVVGQIAQTAAIASAASGSSSSRTIRRK